MSGIWTKEMDAMLRDLVRRSVPQKEIAGDLTRRFGKPVSQGQVQRRIKYRGIDASRVRAVSREPA